MKIAEERINKQQANTSIRDTGLKVTEPRLKILDIFQNSPTRHLVAEDIYKKLINEKIEIGLATVYRVLTQFEQAGIIRKQFFEGNKTCYELNDRHNHYHLVCSDCQSVKEFEDKNLENKFSDIASKNGFTINDSLVYLYVSCNKQSERCKLAIASKK